MRASPQIGVLFALLFAAFVGMGDESRVFAQDNRVLREEVIDAPRDLKPSPAPVPAKPGVIRIDGREMRPSKPRLVEPTTPTAAPDEPIPYPRPGNARPYRPGEPLPDILVPMETALEGTSRKGPQVYELVVTEYLNVNGPADPNESSAAILDRIRRGELSAVQTLRCQLAGDLVELRFGPVVTPHSGRLAPDRQFGGDRETQKIGTEMTATSPEQAHDRLIVNLSYKSVHLVEKEHAPPTTESLAFSGTLRLSPGKPVIAGGRSGGESTFLCVRIDEAD